MTTPDPNDILRKMAQAKAETPDDAELAKVMEGFQGFTQKDLPPPEQDAPSAFKTIGDTKQSSTAAPKLRFIDDQGANAAQGAASSGGGDNQTTEQWQREVLTVLRDIFTAVQDIPNQIAEKFNV